MATRAAPLSNPAQLIRTTGAWLERLQEPGVEEERVGGKDLISVFFGEAERVGAVFNSSEYWGSVNVALEGPNPTKRGPEAFAYHGRHEVEESAVEAYLEPSEVQAIFAALSSIDEQTLRQRLRSVTRGRESNDRDDGMWGDIWDEFEDLRRFYEAAAAAGEYVLAMVL